MKTLLKATKFLLVFLAAALFLFGQTSDATVAPAIPSGWTSLPGGGVQTPGPVNIGGTNPVALSDGVIGVGNYKTASTLAQLTADANFAGTVFLTAPVTLTANLTITCDFRPLQGAIITCPSGLSLNVNGGFEAGRYQVFTGAGNVYFGIIPPRVYPEWWYTGSGDYAPSFNSAIAAINGTATYGRAGIIDLDATTYDISALEITKGRILIKGKGAENAGGTGGTSLIETGTSSQFIEFYQISAGGNTGWGIEDCGLVGDASTQQLIYVMGSSYGTFKNLYFNGVANSQTAGITIYGNSTYGGSYYNIIENTNGYGLYHAIVFNAGTTHDVGQNTIINSNCAVISNGSVFYDIQDWHETFIGCNPESSGSNVAAFQLLNATNIMLLNCDVANMMSFAFNDGTGTPSSIYAIGGELPTAYVGDSHITWIGNNINSGGATLMLGGYVMQSTGKGTVSLSNGSASVTVPSGVFCSCRDHTSPTTTVTECDVTGTTLSITGTGTDSIQYLCQ